MRVNEQEATFVLGRTQRLYKTTHTHTHKVLHSLSLLLCLKLQQEICRQHVKQGEKNNLSAGWHQCALIINHLQTIWGPHSENTRDESSVKNILLCPWKELQCVWTGVRSGRCVLQVQNDLKSTAKHNKNINKTTDRSILNNQTELSRPQIGHSIRLWYCWVRGFCCITWLHVFKVQKTLLEPHSLVNNYQQKITENSVSFSLTAGAAAPYCLILWCLSVRCLSCRTDANGRTQTSHSPRDWFDNRGCVVWDELTSSWRVSSAGAKAGRKPPQPCFSCRQPVPTPYLTVRKHTTLWFMRTYRWNDGPNTTSATSHTKLLCEDNQLFKTFKPPNVFITDEGKSDMVSCDRDVLMLLVVML